MTIYVPELVDSSLANCFLLIGMQLGLILTQWGHLHPSRLGRHIAIAFWLSNVSRFRSTKPDYFSEIISRDYGVDPIPAAANPSTFAFTVICVVKESVAWLQIVMAIGVGSMAIAECPVRSAACFPKVDIAQLAGYSLTRPEFSSV